MKCAPLNLQPDDVNVDYSNTDTAQLAQTLGVLSDADSKTGSAAVSSREVRDFYRRINGMVSVLPKSLNKLDRFMSTFLGAQYSFSLRDIVDRRFNGAAQIRSNMVNLTQESSGLIRNALLRDHVAELSRMREHYTDVLRQAGVPKRRIPEVMRDIMEHFDLKAAALSEVDASKQALHTTRYRLHLEKMSSFGLSELDFEPLKELATRIHTAQDEMNQLANAMGINTSNKIEGVGYFTQQYTPMGNRIVAALENEASNLITPQTVRQSLIDGEESLTATVQRSRSTNLYAPSDMTLLVGHMLNYNQAGNLRKLKRLEKRRRAASLTPKSRLKANERLSSIKSEISSLQDKADEILESMKGDTKNNKGVADYLRVSERINDIKAKGNRATPKQLEQLALLQERIKTLPSEPVLPSTTKQKQKEYDSLAAKIKTQRGRARKIENTLNSESTLTQRNLDAVEAYTSGEDFDSLTKFITDTLVNDPVEFVKYLSQNYNTDFIHQLVDSGLLHKLPMTSDEVWRFYKDALPIPLEYRDQLLRTDPVRSLNKYAESLGNAASNSNLFKYVATNGVKDGWTRRVNTPDMEDAADFVKLDDEAFAAFRDSNVTLEGVEQLRGLHIHRQALETLVNVVRLTSSPSGMGQFAQAYARIMKGVAVTALASTASLSRAFLGGLVFGFQASKGNPLYFHSYATNVVDLLAAESGKVAPDWLTGTASSQAVYNVGEGYTRGEILQYIMRVRSTGSDVFGDVANTKGSAERRTDSLTQLRYAAHLASMEVNPSKSLAQNIYSDPVPLLSAYAKNVLSSTGETFNAVISPIITASQLADTAQRMSIIETISHPLFGNGTGFKSLDDAIRYTDEYSPTALHNGQLTTFTNKYVTPFRTYAMFAPGAVMRHAMRNPTLYVNYNRLWSLVNEWGDDDETPVLESEVTETMLNGMPIRVGTDANGNKVFFDVSSIDPSTGEFVNAREQLESLGRALGLRLGSDREVLQSYDPRSNPGAELAYKQLQQLFVPNAVFETVTGIDTFTGRQQGLDTFGKTKFLNVDMPSRLALFLSNIPMLSAYDRTLTQAGQTLEGAVPAQVTALSYLGVRVRVADLLKASNQSVSSLRSSAVSASNVLERSVTKYYEEREGMTQSERVSTEESLRDLSGRVTVLQLELARLEAYMASNGITPSSIERRLKKGSIEAARLEAQLQGQPDPVLTGRSQAVTRFMTENGMIPVEQQQQQ